jgi:hypothetical protein
METLPVRRITPCQAKTMRAVRRRWRPRRRRRLAISAPLLFNGRAHGVKEAHIDSVCANVGGGGGGVGIFYVIAAAAGVGEGVTPLTSSHSRRRAPLPPAALQSQRRTSNLGCSNFCINSLSLALELWPREFLAVAPITLADWIWPLVSVYVCVGGDGAGRKPKITHQATTRVKIIWPRAVEKHFICYARRMGK